MRERAAIRLYAAFLDAPAAALPGMLASSMSSQSLEAWLRVLDVGAGIRDLRRGDPKPDQFKPPAIKVKPPAKVVRSIVARAPTPTDMTFCNQCDRRVTNAEGKACRKAFCKAVVA